MDEVAIRLRDAFVAAYGPYVRSRLAELGIEEPEGFDAALDRGEELLDRRLVELLDGPFERQARGPLEIFQEALEVPTAALREAGFKPVDRDEVAANALPGDLYDLAPASSASLGDEAWHAHLQWGAAKAFAVAAPLVAVVSDNLMDRTRIEAAVRSEGWVPVRFPGDTASQPTLAFVDLESRESDTAIRALASAGVRVIAYGPHVDDLAMVRARSLGATEALPRSRFFTRLSDLLLPIA
jgi:hypothetical protein